MLMDTSDLATFLERLEERGTLAPDEEARLEEFLEGLMRLTLHRQGREQLERIVNQSKRDGDIDAAKAAIVDSGGLDASEVQAVGHFYCDRLLVGVDDWSTYHQEQWVDMCQTVTELCSSIVI
jgi:hypothetical protein